MSGRQPVHTVYGGAHLFRANVASKFGALALAAIDRDAGRDGAAFAEAFGVDADDAVAARVVSKLEREPVEDLRIDFEDGFGPRSDAEEDAEADRSASELVAGVRAGSLPPRIGIRIKSLSTDTRARALATLTRFLGSVARSGVGLPAGFVVTLPKVLAVEDVGLLAETLDRLEADLGFAPRAVGVEIMVEATETIVDDEGRWVLPRMVRAASGRLVAAHLGAYDLAASCDVAATYQTLDHPLNDTARSVMQLCLARTNVWIADGATNVLPIPPHGPAAVAATPSLADENQRAVREAWRLHARNVRRALAQGIYQGWDLHPAQLPARYAAVFGFFAGAANAMGERLRNFVDRASRATALGNVFDDAATGQGLLNFFLRAEQCGALDAAAVGALSGLTMEELRTRSFARIVAARV